ncbi:uncharacterized protein LOC144790661 [Lissotriton helveticus]
MEMSHLYLTRSRNLSDKEFGGLLWLIFHYLPRMISMGGRVSQGYGTVERRGRWMLVQQHLAQLFQVERMTHQIKHRWQDTISREGDVLDHLGLDVGGPTGGPAPYTQGEIASFEDPNATINKNAEDEKSFRIRKARYGHILAVAKGFRWTSRQYDKQKVAKTWIIASPTKKTTEGGQQPVVTSATSTAGGAAGPQRSTSAQTSAASMATSVVKPMQKKIDILESKINILDKNLTRCSRP